MNVAFISELPFVGKVPRNHNNMRTEFAWMCTLDATHFPIFEERISGIWDLIVIILPKKNIDKLIHLDLKNKYSQYSKKVAIMQEGPHWYFQDYKLNEQIWYYNTLTSVDRIYVHNNSDKVYYKGLTNHPDIRVMPSLMIEDAINKNSLIKSNERDNVIIGGNFVSWYGGFDSYIVANEISNVVYTPSMGRKQTDEEHLVKHLPYLNWTDWITTLSKFKYAVHLMRTHAAGTFALNCSYLGIPCIGYKGLDTQETLHPNLTVEIGNIETAKNLIKKLKNDPLFYDEQSSITLDLYNKNYTELKFKETFYR